MQRDQLEGPHEVVDIQQVAHLLAVAIDCERLAGRDRQHEVGDPALVFIAELARSINARHAKHDGAQLVDACVIVHVLVGGALRATIR